MDGPQVGGFVFRDLKLLDGQWQRKNLAESSTELVAAADQSHPQPVPPRGNPHMLFGTSRGIKWQSLPGYSGSETGWLFLWTMLPLVSEGFWGAWSSLMT